MTNHNLSIRHLPTYQLLCLAAQYSERVYEKPRGAERDAVIGGCGQRAMVLKSAPMDELDVIVFAVRGTSTFMDWAVNLNMAPASPLGFLVSVLCFPVACFMTNE